MRREGTTELPEPEKPQLTRREALTQTACVAAFAGLLGAIGHVEPAQAATAGRVGVALGASVMDFGAKADGKADDTDAIQRALDEIGAGGGVVYLPAGRYRVEGVLNVPQSVCLEGVFKTPSRTGVNGGGSILLASAGHGSEDGTPFITLGNNSTLKGLTVFYPEQTPDIAPYPPTVQGNGDDCSLVDVLLINPYFGVDFATHPCGRHWIKSLYMQALRCGISVAECFDVGRIEDVHIWPFWLAGEPKIDAFTSSQGEAFVLARTDWEYMLNCFCIGYRVGYRFTASKSGPGNVVLTQCGSDEGPQSTSVLVEQTQAHAGVSFVNGQFMGKQHISVHPENTGPVKFTACGFWGMQEVTGAMAELEGHGQVSFENCHFIGWAQAGDPDAPAIIAENGGLSVVGCDFMDSGKAQVRIAPGVPATVVANRLRGGAKIDNQAGDLAQIGLNTVG